VLVRHVLDQRAYQMNEGDICEQELDNS
jgi:hypothetical protein